MTDLTTVLLAIVGAVISMAFTFVPSLRSWLAAQSNKGAIILGVLFATSLIYFGLGCSPFALDLKIVVECSTSGAVDLAEAFLALATGNQIAFLLSR